MRQAGKVVFSLWEKPNQLSFVSMWIHTFPLAVCSEVQSENSLLEGKLALFLWDTLKSCIKVCSCTGHLLLLLQTDCCLQMLRMSMFHCDLVKLIVIILLLIILSNVELNLISDLHASTCEGYWQWDWWPVTMIGTLFKSAFCHPSGCIR